MDKNGFKGDLVPVSYRNFFDVQDALHEQGLIDVIPGQGRFKQVNWGKGDVQKWQDKGWATRFSATDALVSLYSPFLKSRGLIRATPLSEGPQSAASRVLVCADRSSRIL